MRMLPVGLDGVLVEVAGLAEAMALHDRLRADPPPGVVEIVPAARTVLVRADPAVLPPARLRAWLRKPATTAPASSTRRAASAVLPTVYDGADLAEVAALLGTSPHALVERHAATAWSVAFTGFAPGFGYLVGAGWDLDAPRREVPRTRVPAGAVGLAGPYAGAYPRETPGGWQLIGATRATLFDPDAAEPALLTPGTSVRFTPVRAEARAAAGTAPSTSDAAAAARRTAPVAEGIRVVEPGLLATVQDAGRPGRAAEGVGRAGAADPQAWALGNRLLGNAAGAAALEVTMGGFRAVAECDLTVVVTGAWTPLTIAGRALDPYVVHPWPAGSELALGWALRGSRAYLGIRGGFDAPRAVGSRSADTLSGLGPAPLRSGDRMPAARETAGPVPALPLHPWGFPRDGSELDRRGPLEVPLLLGPRADWFTAPALGALAEAEWTVSPASDRVGIRLEGPTLERARSEELPSEAMVPGSVQVPPSGRPVVFGVDGPVTGGYPVVGVVPPPSLALLGQARPGSRVRFVLRGSR
ncbi:5-oxoprolinase/urea amidolyase family protein [Microbacterium radiodurans]|uniref:5-oxoprolinase/urea amidolyase family protein n=2 Tax=Microbacterium radiodurans TaxID=661398 RepID=A0A5J5IYN3_9MICO|nr:5-oxoprolinase/urea amidolyase family protein [Microbacterium radiodurans]